MTHPLIPQEDSGGVVTYLLVYLQQCVRLHQVPLQLAVHVRVRLGCCLLSGADSTCGGPFFLSSFLPSMATLSEMFQLELPTVHSIISKMIINEELMVRAGAVRGPLGFFSAFLLALD